MLPRFTLLSKPGGQHSQLSGSGPGRPSSCCVIPVSLHDQTQVCLFQALSNWICSKTVVT